MFPGQGSFEAGMGRDIAEAVPEAMAIYDEGSEASGIDLKELCFDGPIEALVDTEVQQPALVATSLALDAALRAAASSPTTSSAIRSASSRRSARPSRSRRARRSRSFASAGIAMAAAAKEHPGSMAAILGLADEAVENLCRKISNVWPANYNCPGQLVDLRRDAVGRRGVRRGRARGRSPCDPAAGLGRVPLAARRARRRQAAPGDREGASVGRARGVHVDGDREDRGRAAVPRAADRAADRARFEFTQSARELINQGVTTFVEVGPGNVLGGLLKRIDRSVRTFSVNDLKSLDEVSETLG